jgi:hypothetical protein
MVVAVCLAAVMEITGAALLGDRTIDTFQSTVQLSLFYLVKFSTKSGQVVVQQGRVLGVWVSSVTFLII